MGYPTTTPDSDLLQMLTFAADGFNRLRIEMQCSENANFLNKTEAAKFVRG